MLLPISWLKEFVDTSDIDVKRFCDRMTDTGSKVEGYETLSEEISNVKVGRVTKMERHPDSDHMFICMVDIGEAEQSQIVTGAQNVSEGDLVPVACPPAKLPGGVTIKAGKLRGVASNGMLCSIAELGLTLNDMPYAVEDGILILQNDPDLKDCKPGQDVCELLGIRDTVVEFEITPNRPDCLSIIGLAREAAVSFDRGITFHTPAVKGTQGNVSDYLNVQVANADLCPRYTARYVKNVKIAPSPLWLRMRLRAAGVRPINNIVDITNYVMLEYGQPMHAFDAACIDGNEIIVREAAEGEQFISLDSKPHTLKAGMLVIADQKKAVALAGVMGGENSEIKDTTAAVVFESANFLGSSVRTTSRALGMRTESSGRFEKGLDPENTFAAVQRACELVELLGAGEVVGQCEKCGVIDVYKKPWKQTVLPFEPKRYIDLLGVPMKDGEMISILSKLEIPVEDGKIYVPSFRGDIECMNDIAEELIRVHGYNSIPSTKPILEIKTGEYTPEKAAREELSNLLVGMGLYELCTFSFISPKYYDNIRLSEGDPMRRSVTIQNPLGEDTSVMRTTLIPSMLDVLQRNKNYHGKPFAAFENAAIYLPAESADVQPEEPIRISLGFYGMGDFFYMKGLVQAIMQTMGIADLTYESFADSPTFHPGRCARVLAADGTVLGIFGQVHPLAAANYDLTEAYVAELDFGAIFKKSNREKKYRALSKFPSSTRDLALVCEEELEAGKIEAVMKKAGGKLLESVTLFDVYRGVQIGEGKKNLAFSLTFRAADHTVTAEEVDKAIKKVLVLLERELGLTLRA